MLTIIGIGLVVLVGAYPSWGTAQALTGATRVLEAGLQQARTLARAQNAYVAFNYGTVETNAVKTVTGFQIFRYTITNDTTTVDAVLQPLISPPYVADISDDILNITYAAPFQRLSGHVRLGYIRESDIGNAPPPMHAYATLVFRPDGSVWSWDDKQAHYLCISTRERFATDQTTQPLTRHLRVDLATGLVSVIKGVPEP